MHMNKPHTATSPTTNPSLSTSLSGRRLRRNGSLRVAGGGGVVGRSPSMFSTKKSKGGGSGFDNPEPSSPKVTCIGQVRVKTKKQGMKMKMRACRSKSRRHGGGLTPQSSLGGSNNNQDRDLRNQGWVHLPGAICEAIRAFGNEFSCLLPCKSPCFSNCGSERRDNGDGASPCGAVCRWLVAMQDEEEEEKGRREVEIVVEGDGERVECSRRRSIFDDMEFKDEMFEVDSGGKVSGGRVSICVPPKNALLLMRCRSDPMKMSALTQKIWEAPVADFDSEGEDDKVGCGEDVKVVRLEGEKCGEDVKGVCLEGKKCVEVDEICEEVHVDEESGYTNTDNICGISVKWNMEKADVRDEENGYDLDIFNEEEVDIMDGTPLMEGEYKQIGECEKGDVLVEKKIENGESEAALVEETKEEEKEEKTEESNEFSCFSGGSSVDESTFESPEENDQDVDHEIDQQMVKSIDQEIKKPVLPDCLLLMMCEPKLSMEVSKETWVCSTDFIRWQPERNPSKKSAKVDVSDEPKKKKTGGVPPVQEALRVPIQPGRSSISFPTGGGPVVNMIEANLVKPGGGGGGGRIEPLVLSRCKSAPMRSAGKNGLPELPCSLWRRESSRRIEPHRPSFGTTGVGF